MTSEERRFYMTSALLCMNGWITNEIHIKHYTFKYVQDAGYPQTIKTLHGFRPCIPHWKDVPKRSEGEWQGGLPGLGPQPLWDRSKHVEGELTDH